MKSMQVMVWVLSGAIAASAARGDVQTCPANEMSISGTITGATGGLSIDCLFYTTTGDEDYPDGFTSMYFPTAPSGFVYACLPLDDADAGVPPTGTKFQCNANAYLLPGAPLVGESARQVVSAGAKTANIVSTGVPTTTTPPTSSTTTTTGGGSTTPPTTTTLAGSTTTTTTTSTQSTTSTTAPTCTTGCDDADPCTDDPCVDGACTHADKTGLVGVQCQCERASPAACNGQTLPTPVTRRSTATCTALGKITAGASTRKLRRLVRAVTRASNKTRRAVEKAVGKSQLTEACGSALSSRLHDIRTGAGGLLTP